MLLQQLYYGFDKWISEYAFAHEARVCVLVDFETAY